MKNGFAKSVIDIKTLVLMQLKNKLDLSFLHNKKKALLKISLMLLGIIGLTAVVYLLFYVATLLRLFSFGFLFPISVVNVIVTVYLALSIIACTVGLMKSLFFSSDNQFLLTMPVKKTDLFLSKLIVYYINELFKSAVFIIPVMVAFGLINSLPIYFYLWLIVCVFIVSAAPVAVGALLSIPVMLVTILFRQNKVVEVLSVIVVMVLAALLVAKLIMILPENINIVGKWSILYWEIQDFLVAFAKWTYPFYCIMCMIVGPVMGLPAKDFSINSGLLVLAVIAGIILITVLAFLIAKPVFFKMASTPFEYRKKLIKKHYKNHKMPAFFSGVKKEAIGMLRTPEKLYSLLFVALLLPIAILFLNKIFNAMSVRLTGTYMTIVFNILIILLILLSSNSVMAKVFSEEGSAHYLYKTSPQKFYVSLLPKLVIHFLVMTTSLGVTVYVFSFFSNLTTANLAIMFFLCFFLFVAHLFLSAELDIMSPQYDQYQTTGQGSSSENKSVIWAFIISFIVCAFSYLLINEDSQTVYLKVMFLALAFMVFRIYMFFEKVRLYYRQPYGEGR